MWLYSIYSMTFIWNSPSLIPIVQTVGLFMGTQTLSGFIHEYKFIIDFCRMNDPFLLCCVPTLIPWFPYDSFVNEDFIWLISFFFFLIFNLISIWLSFLVSLSILPEFCFPFVLVFLFYLSLFVAPLSCVCILIIILLNSLTSRLEPRQDVTIKVTHILTLFKTKR